MRGSVLLEARFPASRTEHRRRKFHVLGRNSHNLTVLKLERLVCLHSSAFDLSDLPLSTLCRQQPHPLVEIGTWLHSGHALLSALSAAPAPPCPRLRGIRHQAKQGTQLRDDTAASKHGDAATRLMDRLTGSTLHAPKARSGSSSCLCLMDGNRSIDK